MKTKYIRSVFSVNLVLGMLILFIPSCSFQQNGVEIQDKNPVNTDNNFDVSTPTPVQPPTLLSDENFSTKTPTVSHSEQVVNETSTNTPEESYVVPTLTNDEKQKLISDWFLDNANCSFPCWWGITPEITSWNDSNILLTNMGIIIGQKVEISDTDSGYWLGGIQVSTPYGIIDNHMSILVNNESGKVSLIRFDSDGYSDPIAFQEQWVNFSPQMIIQKYGAPSRVWVESSSYSSTMSGEGRIAGYRLWLFYDKTGFLIQYSGYGDLSENYHFCPRFDQGVDIRSILLFIQSPNNKTPIEENAEKLDFIIPDYPHVQTLEECAGITIEEFYSLFIEDPENACFDTPSSIWP